MRGKTVYSAMLSFAAVLLLTVSAQAGGRPLPACFEGGGMGILMLLQSNSTAVRGMLITPEQKWAAFEGRLLQGRFITAQLHVGNRQVPMQFELHSSSRLWLSVSVNNLQPFRANMVYDGERSQIFTPQVMGMIHQRFSSPGRKRRAPARLAAAAGHRSGNSWLVGRWGGDSSFSSNGVYGSSAYSYNFHADGTFTYGSQSELAVKGRRNYRNGRRGNRYSRGNRGQKGGRWQIVGDHLNLQWNSGDRSSRFFLYFDNKGHEQIQLGKGKSITLLSRIYPRH